VKAVAARTTELRQEVAARTAAAEAALAGERRFRALLDKAQDGIALFDRSGRVIAIGASAISHNQTTPAADSAVIQRYIHPADWEAAAVAFTQVAAAPGKTFIHSARVRNPQGDYVWLEGAATNLLDDPAVAAIVVNYRDISERKRAEEQTAYQALLFGHLSDAVIATDLALNVRTWNQAAEAIYGWTAAEAVGRPLVELTRLQQAPGSREQLMEILLTAGVWKGEVTQLHRDGHAISIFAAVSLVRDADGQPAGIVAVNRDMTEQRRAWQALEEERALLAERVAEGTAELRQANHELQAAAQAKDEFIASVSHELRTPLNTILILTELLELETAGPLTTKQRTHLHTLRSNGQHLLRLINDILDFAKLQANRLAVDCAPVGVVEVCQASLSMVTAQAEHKRLQVSFTPDPAAGIVRADAQRTRQILVNLLGNAVKFTPEGGAIGLQVQADATAGRLRFTVWDTGIGIAAADFERLFEPFVQLESGLARRYEGTGLGLPLAAQLARLQGGGVEVQSEQGKGSAFTLWLPWG
jgi:PAS domain S-box-containing protein